MESIVALDGSTLDFVPMWDAGVRDVRDFSTTLAGMKEQSLFFQNLFLAHVQGMDTFRGGTYFIKRRGQDKYIGVVHAVVSESNYVSPEVAISTEYRGNGYGRAAIISVCSDIEERGLSGVMMLAHDGYNDAFCESLGMHHSVNGWFVNTKEVISC